MRLEDVVDAPYDPKRCRELRELFESLEILRPRRFHRHDPGDELALRIEGVHPPSTGEARFRVERFVGGGFAGQVYRCRLIDVGWDAEPVHGLVPGSVYAVKILIPPGRLGRAFRDLLHAIAFQSPFAARSNRHACRSGLLLQRLLRHAARERFGTASAVAEPFASFHHPESHSFGEIVEWIEGRTWKLEIDVHLFARRRLMRDRQEGVGTVASAEYVAKYRFMKDLVALMTEMGASELARQYEWWTGKSQPNVLKRAAGGSGPGEGLTALDFRAGLVLLPFLPMSPVDPKLILRGLLRGRPVQFDRLDIDRLRSFLAARAPAFDVVDPVARALEREDALYRSSRPDLTYQGLRLLGSRDLRRSVRDGLVESWSCLGLVDDAGAERLRASRVLFVLFLVAGAIPFLGRGLRRAWGNAVFRRHLRNVWTRPGYARRTLRARQVETLLAWSRERRADEERIARLLGRPLRQWLESVTLGLLPRRWHRILSDPRYAWQRMRAAVTEPIRFYRDREFREAWLRSTVLAGYAEGMLDEGERDRILASVGDPFLQRYLECMAVHFCTFPMTRVVAATVAFGYVLWKGIPWSQAWWQAGLILAVFQVMPFSPGSLFRGSYVVYVMIRERNARDYWVAAATSFWHYISYFAFPLQMVTRFPSLARYLGGRWATRIARLVPVFGERGGLLEHYAYDACFNLPLAVWNRFQRRSALVGRGSSEPSPPL